jgi:hypothetical protein
MPHKDIEVRRAYHREYRRRNSAIRAAQRPDEDRARHANQRAAKYGAPGRISTSDVRQILSKGRCHYCGSTECLGIDHVIPLYAKGPNEPRNIVPCCHSCNASKHRRDRPGHWSHEHDACVICGTTERKHSSKGRCVSCDSTERTRQSRRKH